MGPFSMLNSGRFWEGGLGSGPMAQEASCQGGPGSLSSKNELPTDLKPEVHPWGLPFSPSLSKTY